MKRKLKMTVTKIRHQTFVGGTSGALSFCPLCGSEIKTPAAADAGGAVPESEHLTAESPPANNKLLACADSNSQKGD